MGFSWGAEKLSQARGWGPWTLTHWTLDLLEIALAQRHQLWWVSQKTPKDGANWETGRAIPSSGFWERKFCFKNLFLLKIKIFQKSCSSGTTLQRSSCWGCSFPRTLSPRTWPWDPNILSNWTEPFLSRGSMVAFVRVWWLRCYQPRSAGREQLRMGFNMTAAQNAFQLPGTRSSLKTTVMRRITWKSNIPATWIFCVLVCVCVEGACFSLGALGLHFRWGAK